MIKGRYDSSLHITEKLEEGMDLYYGVAPEGSLNLWVKITKREIQLNIRRNFLIASPGGKRLPCDGLVNSLVLS